MSLLDRAQGVAVRRKVRGVDPETIDLAIAWALGRVSITQVAEALGYGDATSTAYVPMATALREAVRTGRLVAPEVKP